MDVTRKFDAHYAEAAKAYARRPFWFTEVGQIHAAVPLLTTVNFILDVGCNNGKLAAVWDALYPNAVVFGVDVNKDAILQGRTIYPRVQLIAYDGVKLPYGPGSMSLVTCLNTLGHAEQPWTLLAEMARVVAPGGDIVIVVPNQNYYTWADALDGSKGDATIRTTFTPKTLRRDLVGLHKIAKIHISTFGRGLPFWSSCKSRILVHIQKRRQHV